MMIDDDTLDSFQDIPEKKSKFYNKLSAKSKLLVIHALDSGHSESEVAKDYNVTQRTIGNIYKQKEFLLQNYALKLIGAHQINIDQALLEWFLLETKCGNFISKSMFHQKALEILKTRGLESVDIEDWLQGFRIKHNIAEFADIRCNLEIKEEWMKFLSHFNSSDIYLVGMFALSHSLDTESYLRGLSSEDYVSMMFVVNTTGTDKQQLAVIGKNTIVNNAVSSLPVKYYPCHADTPQINYFILKDYLENWDNVLSKAGKSILLIANLPDNVLHKLKFENIKLLATKNFEYVTHVLEKIIECFKFHYRRLEMIQRIESKNSCMSQSSDYIHMFAMAWHTVSGRYIELLCSPQVGGFLYFDINGENYGDHSLSHWYKMKNIPLDLDQRSDLLLDKHIHCDSKLKCINWREVDVPSTSLNVINTSLEITEACTSLEAYQAMRRLVSYLQDQNAGPVIKHAKNLENHVEYRVLTQMHARNKWD